MQDKHLLPGQQLTLAEAVSERGWFRSALKLGFPIPAIMVTHSLHGCGACKEYTQHALSLIHLLLGPER